MRFYLTETVLFRLSNPSTNPQTKVNKERLGLYDKVNKPGGGGMSFICDITTIHELLMNIIEIIVNYFNLYDDLPTNIVATSQFAHSSNQGN